MGFLDRLLGREPKARQGYPQHHPSSGRQPAGRAPVGEDERAVARYTYLLRTASPEQLEAVHAEAFARLTPQQRQQLLGELSQSMPAGEQVRSDSPQDLARAATRAEMRRPGYLQSTFSRASFGGGGMGMGGAIMGSMLGTIGGVIVGSAIADAIFDYGDYDRSPEAMEAGDSGEAAAADMGGGDGGYDGGGDGGGDSGSDAAETGYDSGGVDSGGDFGGGDFGGGDFGGF